MNLQKGKREPIIGSMRILHVVPTYFPATRYGGPIESVHALNKWLVRQGAEVEVFTTTIDGETDLDVPTNAPVDIDGVKVHYFKPGFPRAWFYSGSMRRALAARAKEFDLIHATSVFLSASTLAARAARLAGKPCIISPRGSLMKATFENKGAKKKIYMKFVESGNLAAADAIHFTTALEEKEYRDFGFPIKKGIVVVNGLDTDALPPGDPAAFREKFGIAPGKEIILFLSRINWKKGLDTLIESFSGLAKDVPEAVLVLAGGDDEGYRAKVGEMIQKAGMKDRVIWTGELKAAERSSAYEAASVFVLPSYAENFGVVVAEAMHFGLPVVVTPEVGLAPWIDRHEAGFVVKKDPLQVKFALFKLLSNPKLGKEMGKRGKKVVEYEFSYESVAKQFTEAYTQLIKNHENS